MVKQLAFAALVASSLTSFAATSGATAHSAVSAVAVSSEAQQAFRRTARKARAALRKEPGSDPFEQTPDSRVLLLGGGKPIALPACGDASGQRSNRPSDSSPKGFFLVTDQDGTRLTHAVDFGSPSGILYESFQGGIVRSQFDDTSPASPAPIEVPMVAPAGSLLAYVPFTGRLKNLSSEMSVVPRATGRTDCPTVEAVHNEQDEALQLVFVPAGFGEEELATFRCAVSLLVDDLRNHTPLRDRSDIGYYRMDLIDQSPGIEVDSSACSCCGAAGCELDKAVLDPQMECPDLFDECPGHVVPSYDSGARGCYEDQYDKVFDPTYAIEKIVAKCFCEADIIVALANASAYAGAARLSELQARPLVMATLHRIDEPAARWELIAHELGHGFGLLDEYVTGEGPDYIRNRNVISKSDLLSTDHAWQLPAWDGKCEGTPCKNLATRCPVQCDRSDSECLRGLTCELRNGECVCDACEDCPEMKGPGGKTGLYQGALYHPTEYFRSRPHCVMHSSSLEFCEPCAHRIRTLGAKQARDGDSVAKGSLAWLDSEGNSGNAGARVRLEARIKVKSFPMIIEVDRMMFEADGSHYEVSVGEPGQPPKVVVNGQPAQWADSLLEMSKTNIKVRSAATGRSYKAEFLRAVRSPSGP